MKLSFYPLGKMTTLHVNTAKYSVVTVTHKAPKIKTFLPKWCNQAPSISRPSRYDHFANPQCN